MKMVKLRVNGQDFAEFQLIRATLQLRGLSPVSQPFVFVRVKLYHLSDDGKWDDQGTGHVTIDYLERSKDLALYVIDEEDNETLLLHHINPKDSYRKYYNFLKRSINVNRITTRCKITTKCKI